MNYFFNAIRSVYSQLTVADQYAVYGRTATLRRILKKPAYLAQVAANKTLNRDRTFQFNGANLKYFHHFYNNTSCNERTIEIPIALHFVKPDLRILEVGNVLNHYAPFPHDVVDRYEPDPTVINQDIVDFNAPRYELIICISTLEHLGWDEAIKDPEKPRKAIEHLQSNLLADQGTMVVTVPDGENPHLSSYINQISCHQHIRFQRYARFSDWRQVQQIESQLGYGSPYPGANALHVLIFRNRGNSAPAAERPA